MKIVKLNTYNDEGGVSYQLLFKSDENVRAELVIYFDEVNLDGDGYISLYLHGRYSGIIDVSKNEELNTQLKELKRRNN
ncbi:TPA: hypothetical protein NJ322_004301 [Vibrio parahaemolyticus]|nr:hypothetical protein [Vibrio parahaemolyticus]